MKKLKLEELGRISVDQFKNTDKIPLCILLDNVRSLHNVGSAFRTADAFLVEKIILSGITGKPPHREIEKTALGATESVEWIYFEKPADAVDEMKRNGYKIVAVEQTSESIPLQEYKFDLNEKICLVFGNEINGVCEEIISKTDIAIEVPQHGTKHSLNISVCLGIVIWEIFKKRI